jgi:hydroxymethylglutaryl-CoA lyase
MSNTQTSLLTIVANERGAEQAALFPQVQYLGFPFSISPTFQQRNANSTLDESLIRVRHIQEIARQSGKRLVVYLSMGFGNPYGDAYSLEILMDWASKLVDEGVEILSIADTVGLATAEEVKSVSRHLVTQLSDITVGVHLHAAPHQWKEKLEAALEAGCLRIDGALKGIGGCPMAGDHLVGNLDSALVIPYLQSRGIMPSLSEPALQKALEKAQILFNS